MHKTSEYKIKVRVLLGYLILREASKNYSVDVNLVPFIGRV